MAGATGLSPSEEQNSCSDEETVKGDRDDDHIIDILEEERHLQSTPVLPIGGSSIRNRYRELVEAEHDTASEDGSTDAIPRRAGSPADSLLSIPDDSPSVQVCCFQANSGLLFTRAYAGAGICRFVPGKQRRAASSWVAPRPEESDPFLQTI